MRVRSMSSAVPSSSPSVTPSAKMSAGHAPSVTSATSGRKKCCSSRPLASRRARRERPPLAISSTRSASGATLAVAGREPFTEERGTQRFDGVELEASRELLGLGERALVVEQARVDRGNGHAELVALSVASARFDRVLETRLREERVQVHPPVGERRPLALKALGQKAPEGLAGVVEHALAALEEEHAGVERPFDVVGVAEPPGFPERRDQPGARGIHVAPDLAAHALQRRAAALGKRRVGGERVHQRAQAQRDAELAERIFLVRVVEVRLHGGGAAHHVVSRVAAARQVLPHHRVTLLRHPRQLGLRRDRVEPDAQPGQAELVGHAFQLTQVFIELGGDGVQIGKRGAAQLELRARLERDRGGPARERDHRAIGGFALRRPTLAFERGEDARDVVRVVDRLAALGEDRELLRLGTDAPRARGLLGLPEDFEELVAVAERTLLVLGSGYAHGCSV
jgi:hypothetical protein